MSTVEKLLNRKAQRLYPTSSSTTELANSFADFFHNKIVTIRNELSEEPTCATQSHSTEERISRAQLKDFRRVTEKEVDHYFDIANTTETIV